MVDVTFLKIFLEGRLDRARRSETGASAVEWVIITAVLVTICVGIGAIILNKINSKANSINIP